MVWISLFLRVWRNVMIISDSGWKTIVSRMCYFKNTRQVVFDVETSDAEIKKYAEEVKKTMYGQVAEARIDGTTVTFIHECDSGD